MDRIVRHRLHPPSLAVSGFFLVSSARGGPPGPRFGRPKVSHTARSCARQGPGQFQPALSLEIRLQKQIRCCPACSPLLLQAWGSFLAGLTDFVHNAAGALEGRFGTEAGPSRPRWIVCLDRLRSHFFVALPSILSHSGIWLPKWCKLGGCWSRQGPGC